MRRRDFIAGLGGVAAWPLMARAQQAAPPVIGLLVTGDAGPNGAYTAAVRAGLRDTGFVEGQNISIEYRFGENDVTRLPELAADLVRRRVMVIATLGGPLPAKAAMAASATTPVVFETGGDPVQAGLVASLNRPGGNATGVSILAPELGPKHLGLLHNMLPMAKHFAVLVSPLAASSSSIIEARINQMQSAAAAIAVQLDVFFATNRAEIDSAFAGLAQKRVDGLVVITGPLFAAREVQIATLAARYMVPTIFSERTFAEVGGLMGYGPIYADELRQVGVYVGRILKGEKPANLPVIQPTRFRLVINLQTAKTLGLQIPPNFLALADEVIE